MRMNAICSIALIVPLKQQLMLRCLKRRLLCSCYKFATATRTSAVFPYTVCNWSLPLMAACWALPLSPEVTARNRLLRCLGVLVMIPVFELTRCLGSKRVVLSHCLSCTIWAFVALCAALHSCLPDMRPSRWTIGAGPCDPSAALWLHLDAAKQSIVVRVPLLLQLGAELTDVWQTWL